MSTESIQQDNKKTLSTRRVLLLVLIVGLGAGVVAYSVGSALAANPSQTAQSIQSSTNGYPAFGPRGWEGGHSGLYRTNETGSRLSFRALSTVSNVSVTGFNIVDTSHVSVSLKWTGSGSTPALTIVSAAPGLSGSNTLAAGWGTTATVSVSMVGTGSLSSSSTCLRVLIAPLTGP